MQHPGSGNVPVLTLSLQIQKLALHLLSHPGPSNILQRLASRKNNVVAIAEGEQYKGGSSSSSRRR